jgi:Adenine-specific methyltransferase EcoRI
MLSKSSNRSLHAAKAAKQDEFYTQYVDIQKEVEAYCTGPDSLVVNQGLRAE